MAAGAQPATSPTAKAARDVITLPSGAVVDQQRIDVMAPATAEDCLALLAVLELKARNLNYQLEQNRNGYHFNGAPITPEHPSDPSWLKRASYALEMTELRIVQLERRLGHFEAAERNTVATRFMETARGLLSPATFEKLAELANVTTTGAP